MMQMQGMSRLVVFLSLLFWMAKGDGAIAIENATRGGGRSTFSSSNQLQLQRQLEEQHRRRRRRQLKNNRVTPTPTSEPSPSPSPAPSKAPLSIPTSGPPVLVDTPTRDPVLDPVQTPTPLQTPTPVQTPTTPVEDPTEQEITIQLRPFSLELEGIVEDADIVRGLLQDYLKQQMSVSLPSLKSIALPLSRSRRRHLRLAGVQVPVRKMQQSSLLEYQGTATFDTNQNSPTPVPTITQVQAAQTDALEDVDSLQAFLAQNSNSNSSPQSQNIQLQKVQVDSESPVFAQANDGIPITNNKNKEGNGNGGILAGVIVGAVLVAFVIFFVHGKYTRSKPPPPPPLELEIIPDIDEHDLEKEGGGATEVVLWKEKEAALAPSSAGDILQGLKEGQAHVQAQAQAAPTTSTTTHQRDDDNDDNDTQGSISKNSVTVTVDRNGSFVSSAMTKPQKQQIKKEKKSQYSEPVEDMSSQSQSLKKTLLSLVPDHAGNMEVNYIEDEQAVIDLTKPSAHSQAMSTFQTTETPRPAFQAGGGSGRNSNTEKPKPLSMRSKVMQKFQAKVGNEKPIKNQSQRPPFVLTPAASYEQEDAANPPEKTTIECSAVFIPKAAAPEMPKEATSASTSAAAAAAPKLERSNTFDSFEDAARSLLSMVSGDDEDSMAGFSLAGDGPNAENNGAAAIISRTRSQQKRQKEEGIVSQGIKWMKLQQNVNRYREFVSEKNTEDASISDSASESAFTYDGVPSGNASLGPGGLEATEETSVFAQLNTTNPALTGNHKSDVFNKNCKVEDDHSDVDDIFDEDEDADEESSSSKEDGGDSSTVQTESSDNEGVYTSPGQSLPYGSLAPPTVSIETIIME
jgi:hypothetical protein